MFNSDKIANLQGQVETLTNELNAANATIAGFDAEKADLLAKVQAANDKAAEAVNALEAAKAEHATELETKLNEQAATHAADIEQKISAAVIERCASAGIDPIKVGSSSASEEKIMSREDFSKMTPYQQATFCRQGGKLTD